MANLNIDKDRSKPKMDKSGKDNKKLSLKGMDKLQKGKPVDDAGKKGKLEMNTKPPQGKSRSGIGEHMNKAMRNRNEKAK